MDELNEIYNEWANDELIWSKGMFNWCQSYSREEWFKPPLYDDYDDIIKVKIPF